VNLNNLSRSRLTNLAIGSGLSGSLLLLGAPAFAHHAMDGKMPGNFFEGFMSGMAHPIIGPDHLAFVIAIGLIAAVQTRGILIPIAFLLSAMLGTGIHLAKIDLPIVELIVSASILLFGILLAMKSRPSTLAIAGMAGLAGIFHGYAYGESIVGAETTPFVAYLAGFTVIQLAISLTAMTIASKALTFPGNWGAMAFTKTVDRVAEQPSLNLRSPGLVIAGIGTAFFVSNLISLLFPAA
jgi:urease accessory protein